jgi:flagellar biosynthesis chaperone FliJ
MISTEKKAKRLHPIIEERQVVFDHENQKLLQMRQRRLEVVAQMKIMQREYVSGVDRLNEERCSAERNKLAALEMGLDAVKQTWMRLYEQIIELEKAEQAQTEVMSEAHKSLESIKHLQNKYFEQLKTELNKREQKDNDEFALRKYYSR